MKLMPPYQLKRTIPKYLKTLFFPDLDLHHGRKNEHKITHLSISTSDNEGNFWYGVERVVESEEQKPQGSTTSICNQEVRITALFTVRL